MANTKSALKQMRQNEKRRLRNRIVRSRIRTAVKAAQEALGQKSQDVKARVVEAVQILDKAVTKGVIHKNTAARKKSAVARRLAALS